VTPVRLLVTRPEPDAARTAALLRARGHEVLTAPVLRVDAMAPELGSGPWSGLLLTSANAARALAAHPRRRELYDAAVLAVGRRTADAARDAGFADVSSADGDVAALADLAAKKFAGTGARLIYLAGEDRAGDLAENLSRRGLDVETVTIYRAAAVPALAPEVQTAIAAREIDGVLHYSRRSAAAFLAGVARGDIPPAALGLAHYCLSAEVAAPLAAAGAQTIHIAARPDEAALIDLLDARRGA